MMPAFQPTSNIFLPQKGTADGHDAGLQFAETHLLVAGSAADARDAGLDCGVAIHWPRKLRLMLMMLALNPRSHIFWSQEVLMLVMRAKGSEADAHDAGLESAESHLLVAGAAADARDAGLDSGECHSLATETAADAHDTGLEFAESHLLVAGSAADAPDAGLEAGECHPLATLTAADAHDAGFPADE